MKNRFILLIILGLLIFQMGCAKTPVLLSRAVVYNATNHKIVNVKLLHIPTQKSGEVNAILPQKMLDIGLPGNPLLADQAVISWQDLAGTKHEISLTIPHDKIAAKEEQLKELIYIIHPSGAVTAELR